MFTGLTEEICAKAWRMVLPSVDYIADAKITNKLDGMIVVITNRDPENILFISPVGREVNQKYSDIADAKAMVSIKTGLPSRVVQQEAPQLYQPGWTKWGGSVVRPGFVVAFSGVQAVFDEMIAGWMAEAIIALCRHEMTREGGVMDNDSSFIDGDVDVTAHRQFPYSSPELRGGPGHTGR